MRLRFIKMENKIDCDKMNIKNNEVVESKNDFSNLKEFIKRWNDKIKQIKNLSLNDKQSYHIAQDYINEASYKFFYQDPIKNKFLLLDQLGHDLFIALFQANNNYKKEFPSFWDKFHNIKLPDLNLIKKG